MIIIMKNKPFKFYFIVLSKKDITCDVYLTSKETMNNGKRLVFEALKKYVKAKQTGIWKDDVKPELINENYEILEI